MNELQLAAAGLLGVAVSLAYGKDVWDVLPKPRLGRWKFSKQARGKITIAGINIADDDRLRHTHVVGATGSGKTVLMESMIYEDIARGYGMLIIDPKGDHTLFERVKSFCERMDRSGDLHLISANYLNQSVRWNPCRLGSPSEIQSKLLNAWVFSEPFYQKACEALLLRSLNEIGDRDFSLADLTGTLKELAGKDETGKSLFLDIFNLISGEYGEVLCSAPPKFTKKEISLLEVIRKNEILFLELPTEGKSYQSERLGKMVLQELLLVSGMRKSYPHLMGPLPFSVYIDEFDAFASKNFVTFLNKGRSSNFMVHIFHQTLSDLSKDELGGINYQRQILGNINVRFIFRQDIPEDAETWSKFFGTKMATKMTQKISQGSSTGDGSLRDTREFRIHPDTIKELQVGECIASIKNRKLLRQLKLKMPNPEGYPTRRFVYRSEYTSKEIRHSLDALTEEFQTKDTKKLEKKEIVL